MKAVARLLNDMIAEGILTDYAVFGAVAQMRYTEAVATMDVDVLVILPGEPGLDILRPIYEFCRRRGLEPRGEAVRVGDWPVQFIPAFSTLTEDAVRHADAAEIDAVSIRVVRPDYLAVIALSTGRPKDFARILSLLESGAVTREEIERLADDFGLRSEWRSFKERFLGG
jgi:hypothetical protein